MAVRPHGQEDDQLARDPFHTHYYAHGGVLVRRETEAMEGGQDVITSQE